MALPLVLFAFLVPFWVERVVLPSLFLRVYMLYHRRNQTDMPVGAVVALLFFALGAALSLGAPGNFAKASVANAFQLGTFISNAVTLAYKYFYIVSIPPWFPFSPSWHFRKNPVKSIRFLPLLF